MVDTFLFALQIDNHDLGNILSFENLYHGILLWMLSIINNKTKHMKRLDILYILHHIDRYKTLIICAYCLIQQNHQKLELVETFSDKSYAT